MRKRSEILLLLFIILLPLISAGNYGAGTYNKGVYGVGEVTSSSPTGGGGSSCNYKWNCTDWFPNECPISGTQERLCMNKGTCTGTVGMPNQTRICTYEHKEPLFDIFLTLLSSSERICSGDKIKANIKLENYGKIELLDAFMTYWIVDKNNSLISELKDTRNVVDKINFDISINIPDSTSPGTYRLYAQITYSENKTAVAGESFEINDGSYCKRFSFLGNILLILLGIVFIIIIILIIILFRKFPYAENKNKIVKEKSTENFKELIHSVKKSRKEFSEYLKKITKTYSIGKISLSTYTRLLFEKRNGKDVQEWIEYFKRYKKELKKRNKLSRK